MEIKYTIRIKEKHNPPTFKEELGKGVVATQIADFKVANEKDLGEPNLQRQIFELAEKLKNEWFEVVFEINNP
jgi:hypothetical protein